VLEIQLNIRFFKAMINFIFTFYKCTTGFNMISVLDVITRSMNTNHDASYLLISVLLLALSFSGTALGQSNNLDSLIPLNGIEGKF